MKPTEDKKVNIITDCAPVKGGADYSFICRKIPFAVTCTSDLAPGAYNYIDLDLVNKMRIPLLNIKVTRMCLHGQDVRVVGSISQTVQCVNKGRVQGTVHIEAKVIRNLFDTLNVDCIASTKTYTRLTGRGPPEPPDDEVPEVNTDVDVLNGHEDAEDEEHLDQGPDVKGPDEPDPPDDTKLNAMDRYEDIEDFVANAPWSRQCLPRGSRHWFQHGRRHPNSEGEDEEDDGHDDVIRAVAFGYPDPRFANLGKLGPTDHLIASLQDDDNDGYGKDRSAHKLHPSMRNQPLDPFFAEHGHYQSQTLPTMSSNPGARKYCRMCHLSKKTTAVYRSHHTLDPSCPSTSEQDKERIKKRMEDGEM